VLALRGKNRILIADRYLFTYFVLYLMIPGSIKVLSSFVV
jgi:hypothetical protein